MSKYNNSCTAWEMHLPCWHKTFTLWWFLPPSPPSPPPSLLPVLELLLIKHLSSQRSKGVSYSPDKEPYLHITPEMYTLYSHTPRSIIPVSLISFITSISSNSLPNRDLETYFIHDHFNSFFLQNGDKKSFPNVMFKAEHYTNDITRLSLHLLLHPDTRLHF